MIQIADGAMQGIEDNTQRIRVLTLQASNDTLSDDNRASIQKEIDALSNSSSDIASSTSYNGINLLDGSGGSQGDGTFVTQSGAEAGSSFSFSIADARSMVGTVDVTTKAGRDTALDTIDASLKSISSSRSDLGAAQNGLISSINNTTVSQVNAASAASQLADIDFAQESANFSKQNILAQSGSFAQVQANNINANLASLLG